MNLTFNIDDINIINNYIRKVMKWTNEDGFGRTQLPVYKEFRINDNCELVAILFEGTTINIPKDIIDITQLAIKV